MNRQEYIRLLQVAERNRQDLVEKLDELEFFYMQEAAKLRSMISKPGTVTISREEWRQLVLKAEHVNSTWDYSALHWIEYELFGKED